MTITERLLELRDEFREAGAVLVRYHYREGGMAVDFLEVLDATGEAMDVDVEDLAGCLHAYDGRLSGVIEWHLANDTMTHKFTVVRSEQIDLRKELAEERLAVK